MDREVQSAEYALKFLIVERLHALEGDGGEGGGQRGELSGAVDSPGALAVDGRVEGRAKEAAVVFLAAEGDEGEKGSDEVTHPSKAFEDRRLERIEALLVSLGQKIDDVRSAERDGRLDRIESKLTSLESRWPAQTRAPEPRDGGDGLWEEGRQGGATGKVNGSAHNQHVRHEQADTVLIKPRRSQIEEEEGEEDGGWLQEGGGRSSSHPGRGSAGEERHVRDSPVLQHHSSNQSRIRMTAFDLQKAQHAFPRRDCTSKSEAATLSRHSNQAHLTLDQLPRLTPSRSSSPSNRFRDAQHAQARRQSHSPRHLHPRRRPTEPESVTDRLLSTEDQLPFHHQTSHHGTGREHGHGKAHGRHASNGVRARAQSGSAAGDGDILPRGMWEQAIDEHILNTRKRHQETIKKGDGHGGGFTVLESTPSGQNNARYHAVSSSTILR